MKARIELITGPVREYVTSTRGEFYLLGTWLTLVDDKEEVVTYRADMVLCYGFIEADNA